MTNKPVKAIQVAKYFVDMANEKEYTGITPLKLIKMVYIAHGWMLALYDKSLIIEPVEAWKYGPVIHSLYKEVKSFGSQQVSNIDDKYSFTPDEEQKSIMIQTYENYHNLAASQMIDLTHKDGTPWEQVYSGELYEEIDNEIIKEYYKKLLVDLPSD